jgi:hypothetical protein
VGSTFEPSYEQISVNITPAYSPAPLDKIVKKRPLSVTVLGWLFMVTGGVGLAYHFPELWAHQRFDSGAFWVCVVRVLAIAGGIFLLRGRDWARALLAAWMVYHIVLSAFHSPVELLTHVVLFSVIAFFLFRPQVSDWFRCRKGVAE